MATGQDVVNYAMSKKNQKVTVPTNPYGGQCVAFNDHIIQHFTNGEKNLAYTNAKDTLAKAKQQGLIVEYNNDPDKYPQPGDSVVFDWGSDPYGHIGIVIEATPTVFHTLEQNVDGWKDENGNGENDQLEIGGGGYVREMWRPVSDYKYVTGWFRLKYDEPKPQNKTNTTTTNPLTEDDEMFMINAPGRGIAVMQGGVFLPILDAKTPANLTANGVKMLIIDPKTFDLWQSRSNVTYIDKSSINKLADAMLVSEKEKK